MKSTLLFCYFLLSNCWFSNLKKKQFKNKTLQGMLVASWMVEFFMAHFTIAVEWLFSIPIYIYVRNNMFVQLPRQQLRTRRQQHLQRFQRPQIRFQQLQLLFLHLQRFPQHQLHFRLQTQLQQHRPLFLHLQRFLQLQLLFQLQTQFQRHQLLFQQFLDKFTELEIPFIGRLYSI